MKRPGPNISPAAGTCRSSSRMDARDSVLPFAIMERFQARLKAFGLNVTWLPFDGGHGIPDEVGIARG